jgi:plastocyanin
LAATAYRHVEQRRRIEMTRARIAVVVGLAAFALVVAGCGGSDDEASGTTDTTTETTTETTASGSTLTASVGPGFEISLTDASGNDVSSLTAGSYTIEVDDQSDAHNFHLTGSGVDESKGVDGTGTETWTVTFEAGSYHFQCDPHASTMNGDFEVTG